MDGLFPDTYIESRARFLQDFDRLRTHWPGSRIESYPLTVDTDLTIDCAWAEPREKQNLVLITTGVHGVEGFFGAGVLKVFMDEFGPRLNAENTGVLLVHAVNPWGMHNRRRVNENNVDLNRNFHWDETYDPRINPEYDALTPLLNPAQPLENHFASEIRFYAGFVWSLTRFGFSRVRQGMANGQYRHPRGVYFGGQAAQHSTQVIRSLLLKALDTYEQVIHLDIHTGYGPRYQMNFFNSQRETIPADEMKRRFGYPLIVSGVTDNFYVTSGDINDYFYELRNRKYPAKQLLSTCWEFGTFGNSTAAVVRTGRIIVLENQVYHFGAASAALHDAVSKEYQEWYLPSETRWREKALADARQAFSGVFTDFGIFSSGLSAR